MIARPEQAYLEIFNDFGFNVKAVSFTTCGEADVYSTTVAFILKNFNEKAQRVS